MKPNEQTKHEVCGELCRDKATWSLQLSVDVMDGIVILSGIAPTYENKLAAQNAAYRVEGVLDVVNDIIVKIRHTYSDMDIARAVRQALKRQASIPSEQIKSSVSDGLVKIEGEVNSFRQVKDAEQIIENLPGVNGVLNNLTIKTCLECSENLRQSVKAVGEYQNELEENSIGAKNNEANIYYDIDFKPE